MKVFLNFHHVVNIYFKRRIKVPNSFLFIPHFNPLSSSGFNTFFVFFGAELFG